MQHWTQYTGEDEDKQTKYNENEDKQTKIQQWKRKEKDEQLGFQRKWSKQTRKLDSSFE